MLLQTCSVCGEIGGAAVQCAEVFYYSYCPPSSPGPSVDAVLIVFCDDRHSGLDIEVCYSEWLITVQMGCENAFHVSCGLDGNRCALELRQVTRRNHRIYSHVSCGTF